MKKRYENYRYEIIAALSGGVVMVLELVGARMIAPYFGTSIYVWTAMIGVILGALSLGYWYGGKLADRQANDKGLAVILGAASLAILASVLIREPLLEVMITTSPDIRLQALLAALFLFAPAAVVLGLVSPYVAKLRVQSLETAGQSIGRLYAAGTFGSIIGTFLAGYFLIAWFGNQALGYGLVIVLILTSFLADWRHLRWPRLALVALAGILMMQPVDLAPNVLADVDSTYGRYKVMELPAGQGGVMHALVTDRFSIQSAQLAGQPWSLPLDYSQRFKVVTENLKPDKLLLIGGGTFTFPTAMASQLPRTQIDVVEIDPALEGLARQYFGYQGRPNVKLFFQDGRVFLNQATADQYELILLDAYSSLTPPHQLTTVEAMRSAEHALRPEGVVLANVIAAPEGDPFLAAMTSTYNQVFEHVSIHKVDQLSPDHTRQNLMVLLSDSQVSHQRAATGLGPRLDLPTDASPLTDDYAPVEQLIHRSVSIR